MISHPRFSPRACGEKAAVFDTFPYAPIAKAGTRPSVYPLAASPLLFLLISRPRWACPLPPRRKGSAFGEGIDWMMRRICSVLATSVRRIFPSVARIFNCLQFVSSSLAPSSFRRFFQNRPIGAGVSCRWLIGQNGDHIHPGEVPFFLFLVPGGTDLSTPVFPPLPILQSKQGVLAIFWRIFSKNINLVRNFSLNTLPDALCFFGYSYIMYCVA